MKNTNNLPFLRFIFFILLAVSTSACLNSYVRVQKPVFQNSSQQGIQTIKQEQYVHKFTERKFDETIETDKLSRRAFEELEKENFAWIEQQAEKARKGKELLPGGYWKIAYIYFGLDAPANNTDEAYQKHFERLNRWKEKFPKSITARVALASSWFSYSAEASGTGYAYTVSDEDRKLSHERLENAEKELLEAKNLQGKCPHWYFLMLSLARNQGWEFKDYEALYRDAVAYEPDYYYFQRDKAIYLMPRYHGKSGEWEAYVENVSNEIGGEKGAMMYYLLLSYCTVNINDNYFDKKKFSWEKAKRGFDAIEKNFKMEKQRLNEFAKFTVYANETAAAKEAFERIGENWLASIWTSKENFEMHRDIAIYGRHTQIAQK
ncbi:MAG: hypothetical protein WA584_07670 [Pyrinomonadaceae bacterium]